MKKKGRVFIQGSLELDGLEAPSPYSQMRDFGQFTWYLSAPFPHQQSVIDTDTHHIAHAVRIKLLLKGTQSSYVCSRVSNQNQLLLQLS